MQETLIGLVLGATGWTLLEYIIHYPLGHLPKGKTLISAEHLAHHKNVMYFTPLPKKIRGIIPVFSLIGAAAYYFVGPYFSLGFLAAISAGWSAYEYLHQDIHVRGPKTAYGRWASKHHLYHHFVKPNKNHGVTSPIWDFVFGTYELPKQVTLRERDVQRVAWLSEALAKGENAPAFVKDYEVRQGGSPAPMSY